MEINTCVSKSKKEVSKMQQITKVIAIYDLANEHCSSDVTRQQMNTATVGILLLPLLLGDNPSYFFQEYEVKLNTFPSLCRLKLLCISCVSGCLFLNLCSIVVVVVSITMSYILCTLLLIVPTIQCRWW